MGSQSDNQIDRPSSHGLALDLYKRGISSSCRRLGETTPQGVIQRISFLITKNASVYYLEGIHDQSETEALIMGTAPQAKVYHDIILYLVFL